MKKKDTNFRKAIPFKKRVAVALYALGSSAECRSIVNLFGISKSIVSKIVIEFCQETYKQLKPQYLNYFPLSRETIEECVNGFEITGLTQCLGAIGIKRTNVYYNLQYNKVFYLDGCHIEVHPASEDAVDYYNYKEWYSTVGGVTILRKII
ncbi:hypothetical protein CVS40_4843 [Lucilia cuprina]|nr:hypothetical protein CVS40_4843 [Lucilia cuprina]